MAGKSHRLRVHSRLARTFSALVVMTAGVVGVSIPIANTASADVAVHTIAAGGTPQAWSPHLADQGPSPYQPLANGTNLTISCYMTGDTVTGPYGSENVWDLISGSSPYPIVTGTFVPDADIWTGSNTPVVPRCPSSWVTGRVLDYQGVGGVSVQTDPRVHATLDWIPANQHVVIKCYIVQSDSWEDGPYGSEDIWDQITGTDGPVDWVPDALIYTGSNSAVVPHC